MILEENLLDFGMKYDPFAIPKTAEAIPTNMGIDNGRKDWHMPQALREFIANGLNKPHFSLSYENGIAIIKDGGAGLKRKDFVLGVSTHRDNEEEIGNFGEGFKMALNTCCREKRNVLIQTKGFSSSAKFTYSDAYETEVLTFYFWPMPKVNVTTIFVECSLEEYTKAKEMFMQISQGFEKVEKEIYQPGGWIYILGLRTSSVNTLFTYDFQGEGAKGVLNRDRNYVDINAVQEWIRNLLAKTKNKTVIEKYLKGYQENPEAIEYLVRFDPEHILPWKKIVNKMPKMVLATTPKTDLLCQLAGYTIVKDAPYNLKRILYAAGVENSDNIKLDSNAGIQNNDRITYPFLKEHYDHLDVPRAITELISNAMDTGAAYNISFENGLAVIEDRGEGLEKRNLLFGKSQKTTEQIGRFNEGLKVASFILAREGRDILVESNGWSYKASFELDQEFHEELLVLTLQKAEARQGTKIIFRCQEWELNEAKNKFILFNEDITEIDKNLYWPEGKIYVNGVYICKKNTIFSYDLKNQNGLLNNDRDFIYMNTAWKEMELTLTKMKNEVQIKKLFQCALDYQDSYVELTFKWNIRNLKKNLWKKVLKELLTERFGKKYCLADDPEIDLLAIDKGYVLLPPMSMQMINLFEFLGVQYAKQVVRCSKSSSMGIISKKLTKEEKSRWEEALTVFQNTMELTEKPNAVLIDEFNPEITSKETEGLYNRETNAIYILRKNLHVSWDKQTALENLVGIIAHEWLHQTTGYHDRTRDFENAMTDYWGKALYQLSQLKKIAE